MLYFLRHAYKYSVTDPHRIFKCEENLEITDDYAIKLYDKLKSYFNKLNFINMCK
jgi:hypothetical protein